MAVCRVYVEPSIHARGLVAAVDSRIQYSPSFRRPGAWAFTATYSHVVGRRAESTVGKLVHDTGTEGTRTRLASRQAEQVFEVNIWDTSPHTCTPQGRTRSGTVARQAKHGLLHEPWKQRGTQKSTERHLRGAGASYKDDNRERHAHTYYSPAPGSQVGHAGKQWPRNSEKRRL